MITRGETEDVLSSGLQPENCQSTAVLPQEHQNSQQQSMTLVAPHYQTTHENFAIGDFQQLQHYSMPSPIAPPPTLKQKQQMQHTFQLSSHNQHQPLLFNQPPPHHPQVSKDQQQHLQQICQLSHSQQVEGMLFIPFRNRKIMSDCTTYNHPLNSNIDECLKILKTHRDEKSNFLVIISSLLVFTPKLLE